MTVGNVLYLLLVIGAFTAFCGTLAFASRLSQTVEIPDAVAAPAPALGEATAALLLGLFQDFYRQEIAAEEDVHRVLPFFATALGLTITALGFAASQLPAWDKVLKVCARDQRILIGG